MPRISLKLPFRQVRGRVSTAGNPEGLILSDARSQGAHARRHNAPVRPATPAQARIRAYTGAASKAYAQLDAATTAAWRELASHITRTNCLGYNYCFTGSAIFNQVNLYRQLHAQPISSSVPSIHLIPGPLTALTAIQNDAGYTHVFASKAGPSENFIAAIRFTPASTNQARQPQRHELRFLSTNPAQSFIAGSGAVLEWFLTPDTFPMPAFYFTRAEIVLLSTEYLARAPQLFPLTEITLP